MNTEYPSYHPNGNRNGSFCRPRPIQKRKQKSKKQGNMTRRVPPRAVLHTAFCPKVQRFPLRTLRVLP